MIAENEKALQISFHLAMSSLYTMSMACSIRCDNKYYYFFMLNEVGRFGDFGTIPKTLFVQCLKQFRTMTQSHKMQSSIYINNIFLKMLIRGYK